MYQRDDELIEQFKNGDRAGRGVGFGEEDPQDIEDACDELGATLLEDVGHGYHLVMWNGRAWLVADVNGWWAVPVEMER